MIMNEHLTGSEKVRIGLRALPYKFHLTGSRYFGGYNEHSDTDYFVQNQRYLETDLKDLGFTRVISRQTDYQDRDCISIWHHELAAIHIQIVKDAEKKLKIQQQLKKSTVLSHIPKEKRYLIWDMAYTLLEMK